MIVGIPHYNDFENLKESLNSFFKSTRLRTEDTLIIINADKKATDNIRDVLSGLPRGFNIVQKEIENKGPLYAYNLLFAFAKEKQQDLFLTQSDVWFPKCKNRDWLHEMRSVARYEGVGMVTCFAGGGTSGGTFINGFPWIGAWCTYIPIRTINVLGGYDENIPLGYGVDIDYSYAVIQQRLKIAIINYWVDHHPNYVENHEHEHVDDFQDKVDKAFIYMRKKWNIPNNAYWEGGNIVELSVEHELDRPKSN